MILSRLQISILTFWTHSLTVTTILSNSNEIQLSSNNLSNFHSWLTWIHFVYIAESFKLKEKSFERTYDVDNALYDYSDNILNEFDEQHKTNLHDLQTFVSNAVANIIKSTFVKNEQKLEVFDDVEKQLLELTSISSDTYQVTFTEVNMTSYPIFKMENNISVSFSTAHAEEYKRFKVWFSLFPFLKEVIVLQLIVETA